METTTINGDLAFYTGRLGAKHVDGLTLHGKTWFEVKIVEGHRAGEIAGTYRAPGTVGPANVSKED